MSLLKLLKLYILSAVVCGGWLTPSFAESDYVHPRVRELEEKLSTDTSNFLKGRLPNTPFLVTVKLDPMYRSERAYDSIGQGEKLPYFNLDSEEIRDEWDDPDKSLNQLIQRVRKIVVSVSLPNGLSEPEANEIKDGVFTLLHLNKARDEVTIQRRDWRLANFDWLSATLVFGGICILLGGLLLINRSSANRIASAVADSKGAGGASIVVPPAPSPQNLSRLPNQRGGDGMSSNVKVNDPLRLKDIVGRIVETLSKSTAFPNRFDIFDLDEFGRKNPEGLGAVLIEFPLETRQRLFAFGAGEWWLEGLTHPGSLDFDALEVFQKLMRNHRDQSAMKWDELVLSIWRLDNKRSDFIRTMSNDEGFAVLHAMPKGVALTTARKAYPGNWAGILKEDFVSQSISDSRTDELTLQAQKQVPLNKMSALERYRQELELLVHLKVADPYEEREIYDALPPDSQIRTKRPPFFVLFDQNEGSLRKLVPSLTIDQWAMVLCELRPAERNKIESLFTEKQRFLYGERSKAFAAQGSPHPGQVGELRDRVAQTIPRILTEIKTEEKSAQAEADRYARTMKRRRGEIDEDEPKSKSNPGEKRAA